MKENQWSITLIEPLFLGWGVRYGGVVDQPKYIQTHIQAQMIAGGKSSALIHRQPCPQHKHQHHNLGGGNSNIAYFHPYFFRKIPILTNSDGLVQPPTGKVICIQKLHTEPLRFDCRSNIPGSKKHQTLETDAESIGGTVKLKNKII